MSQSQIQTIVQNVVTAINDAETAFSIEFEATRKYVPQIDLAKTNAMTVSVFSMRKNSEPLQRGGAKLKTLEVGVAVQVPIGQSNAADPSSNATLDNFDAVAEQLENFFGPELNEQIGATWINTERRVISDPDELRNNGVYTSLIVVTFQWV